jgi:hypothetical protein
MVDETPQAKADRWASNMVDELNRREVEESFHHAKASTCPTCGADAPYHNFGCEETMAPRKYYGAQHIEALFGNASETVSPFKVTGASKGYDKSRVHEALSRDPTADEMKHFDPRELEGSQPGIQRGALEHYMGDEYHHTGRTYADQHNPGNKHPVVYSYPHPVDGTEHHVLLSGHHRATAALLRGEPLLAREIKGSLIPRRKS